jgi:hypothetical protein
LFFAHLSTAAGASKISCTIMCTFIEVSIAIFLVENAKKASRT